MTRTRYHQVLMTIFERVAPRARECFGEKAQMIKAIEEMGELTQMLAKNLNDSPVKAHDIMDEICDVLILANQLRLYFDPEWIDERMIYKLSRTERYLDAQAMTPPSLL